MTSRRKCAERKNTKGEKELCSAFDTNAATTTRLPTVIESAHRIHRRCVRGNTRDMRPRVLCGAYEGNHLAMGTFVAGTAERVRSPGKEDCDSAFHRQFPNRGTPAATRRHAAEFGADQREIEREYGPVHGAECDRFRPDVPTAAGLAK